MRGITIRGGGRMRVRIRDYVEPNDLYHIIKNPWIVTRSEFESSRFSLREIESMALFNIKEALEINQLKVWSGDAGPILIAGARCGRNPEEYLSFFFASDQFSINAIEITRGVRKWLLQASQKYPAGTLYAVSYSQHLRRDRWFKLLGFRKDISASNSEKTTFIYSGIE